MNILILDTETVGVKTENIINIAYKIITVDITNATYKPLLTRNYLISKLFKNLVLLDNCPYTNDKKRISLMGELERGEVKKRTIKQALKQLKKDIERYNVLYCYAFNSPFDKKVIEREEKRHSLPTTINVPFYDIRSYARTYISSKEHTDFCLENNLVTESGRYISTNVESYCKFIYDNKNFNEEHLALSDVEDELNILLYCIKKGCDITREVKPPRLAESGLVFEKTICYKTSDTDTEYYTIEYRRKTEKDNVTTYYK